MGESAQCFGPDPIRTLVSMATDSSHRAKMEENLVGALAHPFLLDLLHFYR